MRSRFRSTVMEQAMVKVAANGSGNAALAKLITRSTCRVGGLLLAGAMAMQSVSCANALETRIIDDFSQITAVQPRPGGGFVLAGALERDAGKTPQGFLHISANGTAFGRAQVLPSPDEQNPDVSVSTLLALPNGDYVAGGWALRPRGKANAWIIRFTPDGDIVWNVLLPNEGNWDQRIFSVKRLRDGRLIAVGRAQAGTEARQPARGLVALLDEANGDQLIEPESAAAVTDALKCGVARCGFQDVAQLADGTLALGGSQTRADGKDDAWLLRLGADLKRIKSISVPEADVAANVIASGIGVSIAGGTRKNLQNPAGVIVTYDRDLVRKTVTALDRVALGLTFARAMQDAPLANKLIVAGEAQRNAAADPNAVGGIVQAQGTAFLESAGAGGPSRFYAVAVDASGVIALVGESAEARGRPTRGLVGLRREASLCEPNAQRVDEISAALAGRGDLRHVGCARADAPAQLKLGNGSKDVAVVVRPLIGDIDAFLVTGGEIVDASFNAGRRAEFLVLPADGKPVGLTVSTAAPYATFEVSLVQPPDRPADGDQQPEQPPFSRWHEMALHVLGYDLLGQPTRERSRGGEVVDVRAVMAFQAERGSQPTGVLNAEQSNQLLKDAARRIDRDGWQAVATVRTIGDRARKSEFSEDPILSQMSGLVHEGRVYGTGTYPFGTFEGEWFDGLDAGTRIRPRLGVLWLADECRVTLYAHEHSVPTMEDYNDTRYQTLADAYLPVLLNSAIGVVRRGRQIVHAGELMEQLSDESDTKAVIDLLCARAPKEVREPEQ
jgi:hypothetical protein